MKANFKKYFKGLIYVIILLITFILGMFSYKNENVRNKILSIRNIKEYSYSKYQLAKNSKAADLFLIIPDSSQTILDQCRARAINDNILRDKNKKEVLGLLVFKSDTFEIELRLKGDYADHWSGDKISYRITMKGDDRLFGMKSFSIQSPETRRDMNEWYFHQLLHEEGLIALRYDFISLIENGKEKGLYAIEESFEKDLIEFNRRKEAPILKFDESILIDAKIINKNNSFSQEQLYMIAKIDFFKGKRTLKDPNLYKQLKYAKALLEQFRRGEITASEAFDIDKAAKLFALCDLIGGHHALRWKNVRFYYNPLLGKLELIGFDSNSGNTIDDIYYFKWRDNSVNQYAVMAWKRNFFEDEAFVEHYFKYLKKYSSPTYLTDFNEKIKKQMNEKLGYFYKESLTYKFLDYIYIENRNTIANSVLKYEAAKKAVNKDYFVHAQLNAPLNYNDGSVSIKIMNNNRSPIHVLGLLNPEEEKINREEKFKVLGLNKKMQAGEVSEVFNLIVPIDSAQLELKRKDNLWVHKKIKLAYQVVGKKDTLFCRIEHFYDSKIQENITSEIGEDLFVINEKEKLIYLKAGVWTFDKSIILPLGYGLKCEKNTSINLVNHANLIVNGPLLLNGSSESPINVESKDTTGTIIVYQASSTSYINYVNFNALSESNNGGLYVSGAVNFYEADVHFKHVSFSNNKSEDALNIVRSEFTMSFVDFENIKSDAFDGDFCKGTISNAIFNKIGNDAIDFSGSIIEVRDIQISEVGDKGISAGENSKLNCFNVQMSDCELGLVSKDFSVLKVNKARLNHVAVPFVVFQKKGVFGAGYIELTDFKATAFVESYLIEKGSQAILDGDTLSFNYENVSSILYGNLYGKKSK